VVGLTLANTEGAIHRDTNLVLCARACSTNAGSSREPFYRLVEAQFERSKFPTPLPGSYTNMRVYRDHGGALMLHTIVYSYAEGAGFAFAAVT
jgi:hypothetical protein